MSVDGFIAGEAIRCLGGPQRRKRNGEIAVPLLAAAPAFKRPGMSDKRSPHRPSANGSVRDVTNAIEARAYAHGVTRSQAALTSALFLVAAPGVVGGLVPW